MNDSADCIIAGGGLIGQLSALYLAREGLAVTLLERGELCRESSWAGGGIISPLIPWDYPDAVSRLVAWSQQHYPALAGELLAETGIDPEWTRSGLLLLDMPPSEEIRNWVARHDVSLEVLAPASVQADEPSLAPVSGPALRLPAVAQVRNPRLCAALRARLGQLGVRLCEHTAVERLRIADGRVQGVETAQGFRAADRVVVAGGAWSASLWPDGVLPVTPVRGQMLQFETRPGLLRHIVLSQGHYLIPRRDGLLLVGSTLEYAGFDKTTTEEARDLLMAEAVRIAPVLADYPLVRHWAGLRPGTSDGVPFICEHNEIKGLYLNVGHFRNGVVMGPASARLLADRMLDRTPFTDPAPYTS
jgi:glycine oxidase